LSAQVGLSLDNRSAMAKLRLRQTADCGALHRSPQLRDRFLGPQGQRRLIDELKRQTLVQGDEDAATRLAAAATILEFASGEDLIVQDGVDRHIDFLLVGEVDVLVHGNLVIRRGAGTQVGEMAVADNSARRSATVRARTLTVVARVDEPAFVAIASTKPELWRAMARELAQRLRQRGALVPRRRLKPFVFIGCAVESNDIAEVVQAGLQHEDCEVEVWHDDTFRPSHYTLEDLIPKVSDADLVILVGAAHDMTTSRKETKPAPRDNVLLELGLGFGACGRERTLLLVPRGVDMKLPTDLRGFSPIEYKDGDPSSLASRIGPAVTAIKERLRALGTRGN
jgi:CRP/FNR family cyclic AMP-dependent transcriptional regulator